MESIGICQLCGQESNLIKAHIIPDFLYDGIKSDHGKIASVDLIENTVKFLNKVFFDRKILCAKCDNETLGQLDDYAAGLLKSQIYPVITNVDRKFGVKEVHEIDFENVDFEKMKLFLLSVLWRSHLTDQEFFRGVKIDNLESRIKDMISHGDPGEDSDFQIAMFSILDVIGKPIPVILTPKVIKLEHLYVSIFSMGGIAYFINLETKLPSKLGKYTLKKTIR